MTEHPSPEELAELRRGMRDFAFARAVPGRALPVLLERCRRARRRQRAVRAAAAGICVVAVAAGAVTTAQHWADGTAAPAASRTTTAAPQPAATAELPTRPEDSTSRAGGQLPLPLHPVYGTAYPFNWYAHCGISHIGFAGKEWKVDRSVKVPRLVGAYTGPAAVPGYVTLVSPTELRFDAPSYIMGVTLHVTTEQAPLCD